VAARYNHTEVCRFLMSQGADMQMKDSAGRTPAQVMRFVIFNSIFSFSYSAARHSKQTAILWIVILCTWGRAATERFSAQLPRAHWIRPASLVLKMLMMLCIKKSS